MRKPVRFLVFLVAPLIVEMVALYFIYNSMITVERATAVAQLQQKLDSFVSGLDASNYIIPEPPEGTSTAVFDISQETWEPIKISSSFPYTYDLPIGVNQTDSILYLTTEVEGTGPKLLVSISEDAAALNQKEASIKQIFLIIFGVGLISTIGIYFFLLRKKQDG